MYGLPANFDSSFLVGRNLEMICFSSSQVYLHFDDQVTITIEGEFSYQLQRSEPDVQAIHMPIMESKLMHLLEHSISEAAGDGNGTLTLVFDNGHVLKCFEASGYESYQIKHGAARLIV
ncbi:MAG: DUF6188 family protein [Candidatus Acidiferrales bacterium]